MINRLHQICQDFKNKPAVLDTSYDELYKQSLLISNTINKATSNSKFIAILGDKDSYLYSSILGTMFSHYGFLPLNLTFGNERIKFMLQSANVDTIIVTPSGLEKFKSLKIDIKTITFDNLETSIYETKKIYSLNNPVYLLFTSGTTGHPKGIEIKYKNLTPYLNFVIDKFKITSKDKISQTFDLTFDLSMHDIFTTFLTGATLFPLKKEDLLMPINFIKEHKLTIWFSVPSVAIYMDKFRLLNKKIHSIRLSLFCGEALPVYLANKWQKFAPLCEMYNLYGPTEGTIAISYFKINDTEYTSSTVPIGTVFPNHKYLILDENLNESNLGELYIAGAQIFDQYIEPKDVFYLKENIKYYKTGDIVQYNQYLIYKDRVDNQIKINGYRVELQEIENLIRNKLNIINVVIYSNNKLIMFYEGNLYLNDEILIICNKYLPQYMLPKDIIQIDKVPINANGKFDKKTLKENYEK